MSTPLPLFLKLAGRRVLVVGAGEIATRKMEELRGIGAKVQVVAPAASERARQLAAEGAVTYSERPFAETDLDGAWLAYAATDDPATQAAVAAEAERRQIFCVAIDDVAHCSAYSGALLRRGELAIAISSGGQAPALARLVRELVEEMLPDESWVEEAHALRERWKTEKKPMGSRFAELVTAFKERAARQPR